MSEPKSNRRLNRRQFLKAAGAASAVAGGAGLGLSGHAAGKDPQTYLGWQNEEGASQTFNRKRYEVDEPTYETVGPTSRPDARVDNIFARRGRLARQYQAVKEGGEFDELLQAYYDEHPEDLELDMLATEEILPKRRADQEEYGDRYILAAAWSSAMGAVSPGPPSGPPEEADFPRPGPDGTPVEPAKMKDPVKTSELIKKIAHELGSTVVGIAKLNHDWVYLHPLPRRGFENVDEPLEVPEHWEYAVVVGTPMSWDPMYANPTYGTSNDAYSRSRIVATRVAAFIKRLGYAARTHIPGNSYDLMVPPVAIDAGLGEQGRNGIMITPELGCNVRPAVVTTNLLLKPDRPIDFGVQDFCAHCKICAENCPAGSITLGDKVEVRGYRRYEINRAKCLNFWNSNLGNSGCRLCISVCPYTRKANWLHKTALRVTANDPTGLSERALTGLQKGLYDAPDPQDYFMPSLGGENASYREPPWWLRTEDFIDLETGDAGV
ncbi:MAG: reductive dehalogenase [Gemmatimonadales bacterium]|nr:reductive dehalogenase [Gemmatimonadales bacterium]NIN11014.1 reductive dehalogenase [Gemmatimonadales bacterium]NIN49611.1 reductive dehalogenase [Gemmatimonadales bacterium]NIP07075.1 reductive dehalogenase [Gemmatimonadales bacterium]NIQ99466.1 reductive dehalogenase [Gemmatimonadales bacterium]